MKKMYSPQKILDSVDFLKWGIKSMPVNAKSKTKWETKMHNSNGKISKPLIVLFRLDISCTAVNLEKYN